MEDNARWAIPLYRRCIAQGPSSCTQAFFMHHLGFAILRASTQYSLLSEESQAAEMAKARALWEDSFSLAQASPGSEHDEGCNHTTAIVTETLAQYDRNMGHLEEAKRRYAEAEVLYHTAGDNQGAERTHQRLLELREVIDWP